MLNFAALFYQFARSAYNPSGADGTEKEEVKRQRYIIVTQSGACYNFNNYDNGSQYSENKLTFITASLEVIMELKKLDYSLTVCKVTSELDIDLNKGFYFIGKTDEEYSLVCTTEDTPINTIERDDGWKSFRIQGVLDFSMIGILSKLSSVLADNKIGILAVSTFNTDYILVKEENFDKALKVLASAGYDIV